MTNARFFVESNGASNTFLCAFTSPSYPFDVRIELDVGGDKGEGVVGQVDVGGFSLAWDALASTSGSCGPGLSERLDRHLAAHLETGPVEGWHAS
jgi:hypothetical protein